MINRIEDHSNEECSDSGDSDSGSNSDNDNNKTCRRAKNQIYQTFDRRKTNVLHNVLKDVGVIVQKDEAMTSVTTDTTRTADARTSGSIGGIFEPINKSKSKIKQEEEREGREEKDITRSSLNKSICSFETKAEHERSNHMEEEDTDKKENNDDDNNDDDNNDNNNFVELGKKERKCYFKGKSKNRREESENKISDIERRFHSIPII